ncbi:MAG TPA: serine hydrolase [Thermoanaerobaculia bacterium]|nr:serine hydrolase [Thermoanaerobaculia bacterium]
MLESAVETLKAEVKKYLTSEIEAGSFPGAVYAIGSSDGIVAEGALGYSVVKPARIRAGIDTIYDVASLTKPLITASLVLRAASDGKFELNEPVSKYLEELRGTEKASITFVDLLSHRAGFQAWYPLYTQGEGDAAYLNAIVRRPLRYKAGTRVIYSCLGFMLLKLALQRVYEKSLEELSAEILFGPLSLQHAGFNPAPERKYEIAATEWGNTNERDMVAERGLTFSRFRNYIIWGETDDGNAYYMGGVGGNAGLFATARDVFSIARSYARGGEGLFPPDVVANATKNHTPGLQENRGLGWQLPASRPDGPASMFSPSAFGHTGFTGTSVWVDPGRNLIVVLLTNRLHPTTHANNMQSVRRKLHLIAVNAWG